MVKFSCMNLQHLLAYQGCVFLLLFLILPEITQFNKLNDFILLYEPVNYDHLPIVKDFYDGLILPSITFNAFGRNFSLQLIVGSNVLSSNARIEVRERQATHQLTTDHIRHFLVEGKVKDDYFSYVHGCMYGDAFDGVIETANENYFVEPARTYFNHSVPFKSIIYRRSDINYTAVACASGNQCYQNHSDEVQGPTVDDLKADFVNLLPNVDPLHPSIPRNCVCTLKVMVDHTYYERAAEKSVPKAIADVVFYVHEANKVFSNTDFDDDGVPDNIGFKIMEVVVWQNKNDHGYYLKEENIHHRKLLLDYVSKFDFGSFCLGLIVVCRVFQDAVLGVALTASPQYNVIGGVCQKLYGESSFNTVLMTVLSAKGLVPRNVILNTITHEIGHSFGADHDPSTAECSPSDGKGGKYLMSFHSLPGVFPNNWRFSPCSKRDMVKVLKFKGRCLIPVGDFLHSVCGNAIQEPGEECDCGDAALCSTVDKCCTPKGGELSDKECTIHRVKGFNCSPRMLPGECCRDNCTIASKEEMKKCNDESNCLQQSVCTGSSARCPRISLPNGLPCRKKSGKCSEGDCILNVCGDLNLAPCDCTALDHECSVCCSGSPGGRKCLPASLSFTPHLEEHQHELVKAEGTPCGHGKGKCVSGVCKMTDYDDASSGPGTLFYVVMGLIGGCLVILAICICIYRERFLPCFYSQTSIDSYQSTPSCFPCRRRRRW